MNGEDCENSDVNVKIEKDNMEGEKEIICDLEKLEDSFY